MRKIFLLLVFSILTIGLNAQSIIGAWEMYSFSQTGEKLKSVVIFVEGYQVISTYETITGKFVSSNGGTWKLDGNTMTERVEFDTSNPERVGSEVSFKVSITDNEIGIDGFDSKMYRIDNGTPGELQGAWLMSGKVRNGANQSRDISRPRKTMKILSGTRFQWIAYNTDTKQFLGTGGGTYTTIDRKYTEKIEFFSKDVSRVGASLIFDFNVVNGNWIHQGFSSKGVPLHEIWSSRE